MSEPRPEIREWLGARGYTPDQIERILKQLDQFDERINRESLFEDLASGAFDIGPIIRAALEDKPLE